MEGPLPCQGREQATRSEGFTSKELVCFPTKGGRIEPPVILLGASCLRPALRT